MPYTPITLTSPALTLALLAAVLMAAVILWRDFRDIRERAVLAVAALTWIWYAPVDLWEWLWK